MLWYYIYIYIQILHGKRLINRMLWTIPERFTGVCPSMSMVRVLCWDCKATDAFPIVVFLFSFASCLTFFQNLGFTQTFWQSSTGFFWGVWWSFISKNGDFKLHFPRKYADIKAVFHSLKSGILWWSNIFTWWPHEMLGCRWLHVGVVSVPVGLQGPLLLMVQKSGDHQLIWQI